MNLPALVDRMRSQMPRLRAQVPFRLRLGVAWLAAGLALATFGPALACTWGAGLPAWEALVYQACEPFCHQLTSRSFVVAGHVMPLCTRCSGMWLGITLGTGLGVLTYWRRRWSVGTLAAVLALALSEVDHLREQSGQPDWPWVRFFLGLILFVGVTVAVSADSLALVFAGLRRLALWPRDRHGRH